MWDATRSSPDAGPSYLDFPVSRTVRLEYLFLITYPVSSVVLEQHKTD
jgi:hypothetical protein